MKLDKKGYDIIKGFEGLKLNAYRDIAGIWTIGYGNITYLDGSKVSPTDKITLEQANKMFEITADKFAVKVDGLIKTKVTQNQFNAVVSLAYNIGLGAFEKSTLLKKLNVNPSDVNIIVEFQKWKNAGGKVVQGLLNRRIKESELYFTK